jgi:hypothetical protein
MLIVRPNKLEHFYLAITFQSSLTFAGNAKSLPKKEASGTCSNWVGSGLALKFWTWLERVSKEKWSSLLALSSAMKEKKIYNIDTSSV